MPLGPRPRRDLWRPSPTTIQPLLRPTWTGAFATRSKARQQRTEMLPLPASAWALGPPPSRARTPPLPRPLRAAPGLPWSAGVPFHPTPIRTPAPPARRFLRLPVRNPILLLLVARTDSLLLLPPLAAYYKRVSVAANAGNQFECVLLRSRGFLRFAGTPLSVRPCCPSSSTAAVGGCCFSAREIGSVDPVG